jgi:hypothetical protein
VDVRRQGAEQDHVDVFRRDPGVLDRLLAGGHGEVRRADTRLGIATFLDAGSLHDPLVGRVDSVLFAQVVVGHDARGDVAAGA